MPTSILQALLEKTEAFLLESLAYQTYTPFKDPLKDGPRSHFEKNYQLLQMALSKCNLEVQLLVKVRDLILRRERLIQVERSYSSLLSLEEKKAAHNRALLIHKSLKEAKEQLVEQNQKIEALTITVGKNPSKGNKQRLNNVLARKENIQARVSNFESQLTLRADIQDINKDITSLIKTLKNEKIDITPQHPLIPTPLYSLALETAFLEREREESYKILSSHIKLYEIVLLRIKLILSKDAYVRNDSKALYGFVKELEEIHNPYLQVDSFLIFAMALEKAEDIETVKGIVMHYKKVMPRLQTQPFFVASINVNLIKNFLDILVAKAKVFRDNVEHIEIFTTLLTLASHVFNDVMVLNDEGKYKILFSKNEFKILEPLGEQIAELQTVLLKEKESLDNSETYSVTLGENSKEISFSQVEDFCEYILRVCEYPINKRQELIAEYPLLLKKLFDEQSVFSPSGIDNQGNIDINNLIAILQVFYAPLAGLNYRLQYQKTLSLLQLSHGALTVYSESEYAGMALMEEGFESYPLPHDTIYIRYLKQYREAALSHLFTYHQEREIRHYEGNNVVVLAIIHRLFRDFKSILEGSITGHENNVDVLKRAISITKRFSTEEYKSHTPGLFFLIMEMTVLVARVTEITCQKLIEENASMEHEESLMDKLKEIDTKYEKCSHFYDFLNQLTETFLYNQLYCCIDLVDVKTLVDDVYLCSESRESLRMSGEHWKFYYKNFTEIVFERALKGLQSLSTGLLLKKEKAIVDLSNQLKSVSENPTQEIKKRKKKKKKAPVIENVDSHIELSTLKVDMSATPSDNKEPEKPSQASSPVVLPKDNNNPVPTEILNYFIPAEIANIKGKAFPKSVTVEKEVFILVRFESALGFYVPEKNKNSYSKEMKESHLKNPHELILVKTSRGIQTYSPWVMVERKVLYFKTSEYFNGRRALPALPKCLIVSANITVETAPHIRWKDFPVGIYHGNITELFLNYRDSVWLENFTFDHLKQNYPKSSWDGFLWKLYEYEESLYKNLVAEATKQYPKKFFNERVIALQRALQKRLGTLHVLLSGSIVVDAMHEDFCDVDFQIAGEESELVKYFDFKSTSLYCLKQLPALDSLIFKTLRKVGLEGCGVDFSISHPAAPSPDFSHTRLKFSLSDGLLFLDKRDLFNGVNKLLVPTEDPKELYKKNFKAYLRTVHRLGPRHRWVPGETLVEGLSSFNTCYTVKVLQENRITLAELQWKLGDYTRKDGQDFWCALWESGFLQRLLFGKMINKQELPKDFNVLVAMEYMFKQKGIIEYCNMNFVWFGLRALWDYVCEFAYVSFKKSPLKNYLTVEEYQHFKRHKTTMDKNMPESQSRNKKIPAITFFQQEEQLEQPSKAIPTSPPKMAYGNGMS